MSLEDFGSAFQNTRPFTSDRVSEPRLRHPNVDAIHQEELLRLIRRAREVLTTPGGRGVTLLGDAGVGKSHLLARLHAWSKSDQGATMVFLHNLLVAPDRLPRYLLASTIGVLTGGRREEYGDCELYRLWVAAVRRVMNLADEFPISLDIADKAIQRLSDTTKPIDRLIRHVLLRVGLNMHRAAQGDDNVNHPMIEAGLDWLSGETLEPERIELLKLPAHLEASSGLRDDQDVETVFRTLAEISRRAGRPFILCLDQFENLSEAQVRAICRFFHVLVDHVPNLMCVLSGVTETVLALVERHVISDAAWDRVAEEQISLGLVKPELALQIIEGRIRSFRKPFEELPEIKASIAKDPLFPLTHAGFDERVADAPEVRPRQLIRWARSVWDREVDKTHDLGVPTWLASWPEGGTPPPPDYWDAVVDQTVEERVEEAIALRRKQPGSLPPEPSNIAELLRRLLSVAAQGSELGLKAVEPEEKRSYQLLLTGADGSTTGIAVVATTNGNQGTAAIRKLRFEASKPDRLVLLTDRRRPIKPTQTRAWEHVEALRSSPGFRHAQMDLAAHARYDAMVSTLLQAEAGDIEVEWGGQAKKLTPADVEASYLRTKRLVNDPLLGPLVEPLEQTSSSSGSGDESMSGPGASEPTDSSPAEGPKGSSSIALRIPSKGPDPTTAARHLLGLAAVRGELSIAQAAQIWCEENRGADPAVVQHRLTLAARQLSLAGRLACRTVVGVLKVTRRGGWAHLLV